MADALQIDDGHYYARNAIHALRIARAETSLVNALHTVMSAREFARAAMAIATHAGGLRRYSRLHSAALELANKLVDRCHA